MTRPPAVIERILGIARRRRARIVLPETHDPRVVEAAERLAADGLAAPVLVDRGGTRVPRGCERADSATDPRLPDLARRLHERRKAKGMTADEAASAARDPLVYAGLLVAGGHADGAVAGSMCPTPDTIRAGLWTIGPGPGIATVSSTFLMVLEDGRALTYADCGVVPDPDETQLAEIAVVSARTHRLLTGETPVVAMLSFSTKGSASHPDVDKVVRALARARALDPALAIDGEFQFDAAFVPEVAARKAPGSAVAGRANVFVFPDLGAGNIAYKITQRIGGAEAYGPLIQGLAKPYLDLSRGCSAEDVVLVAAIAAVMAAEQGE